MATAACSIYGLFIACIVSLSLGIATLVLNIVFKYIGFVDSDITLSTCTQAYLSNKYKHLTYQLETSFVGICIGILMNLIVLVLIILTIKNLREAQQNQELRDQILSEQILSKTKSAIIYVLLSCGTLGYVVCFGSYLTMLIEAQKDTSTCSFSYNDTNLLILVIISGVCLLSFLVEQVFVLLVKGYYAQEEVKEQRKNKYKEMINVTEQPGVINKYGYDNTRPEQNNDVLKFMQFAQQPSNVQVQSFGNAKQFNSKPYSSKEQQYTKNPHKYIIQTNVTKDISSNQLFNPAVQTPTSFGGKNHQGLKQSFNSYKQRQLKEEKQKQIKQYLNNKPNTSETENPQKYRVDTNVSVEKRTIDKPYDKYSPSNKYSSPYNNDPVQKNPFMAENNYEKNPSKIYNSSNNLYNPSKYLNQAPKQVYELKNNPTSQSIRNNKLLIQPDYANPFSKPFSPIKMLNQPAHQPNSRFPSPNKQDSSRNPQLIGAISRSPQQQQRILNPSYGKEVYRPEKSYRDENEQNTRGQLVFYKKGIENNRMNENQHNQKPDSYRNDLPRYDKNSSGQLSFKSPSRFDTKFAQEQRNYLSKNTQNSILPMSNRINQSVGSRKNIVDDKYSSGGMHNSYFGQSRGQESIPSPTQGKSRTKTREGILTSFIRGKFA